MVIISSFYNEEYLLPWWLEHHKNIFEHGVLFNYYSTDKSVEIIKSICPTWDIRNTYNKDWDFKDNDNEFMAAEEEFSGYKIVLTTTEFLVGKLPDLSKDLTCYAIPFFRLVDKDPDDKPTYDKPLIEQKKDGFIDKSIMRRFLHNYPDGQYSVGRDKSKLKSKDIEMQIYKYVYSPWTEEFIQRKLSMRSYVNPKNIEKGWGVHHTWNLDRLNKEYNKALLKI